jgi:hypothetical protein
MMDIVTPVPWLTLEVRLRECPELCVVASWTYWELSRDDCWVR